jgi:hypothetical protein
MDIGSASALALYSYQTALRSLGQTGTGSTEPTPDAAVLQALVSTYGNTDASAGGLLPASDALSALAGSSALPSLVSGIYDASVGSGLTELPVANLASSLAAVGGLDATTTASLLGSLGSGGLDGISALSPDATLALTEYANQQNGVAGNLTQAAEAQAASIDTSREAGVLAAIQSAQAASFAGTMNLLA